MVASTIIAIAIALTFFGSKNSYNILKVLAGSAWIGLGVWWVASPFTTAGSPVHTIVLVVVFMAGVACFFWGLWEARFDRSGREVGGRLRLPFMQTNDEEAESEEQRRALPTRAERVSSYRDRLDAASRGRRIR